MNDLTGDLINLIDRIRGALGTDEVGDNLVEVAREAHRSEQELAALLRKLAELMRQLDLNIDDEGED